MADYLPPLVTKLKGDISDLLSAFEESKLAAKAWAADMKRELTADMKVTGRTVSETFRKETKKTFDKDTFLDSAGNTFGRTGAKAAESFAGGFQSVAAAPGPYGMAFIVAAALTAAVFLAPAIGAAIGAALTLGLGVGFIGLGLFLIKDRPKIVKAMAGLGDDISKTFKSAAGPLEKPFLNAIKIIDRAIKQMGPVFRQIFTNIAPLIEPFVKGLTGMFSKMMPGVSEAISNMGPAFKALGDALPGIGEALGGFFADISENGPALSRFITESSVALSKLITALGKTIAWLEGAYLWLSNFAINLKTKWLPDAGGAIKGWYDAVVSWFGKAIDWVKALPGKIGSAIAALPGILKNAAHQAFLDFTYAIGYGVAAAIRWVSELPVKIPLVLGELWDHLTTWAAKLVVAGTAWAKQLWPKAKEGTGELVTKIKDFLKGAPDWLVQTGKDMLTGLVKGVKDSIGWAVGKVKEGMGSILKGAADALGTHSPSTKFAELGVWSLKGYAYAVRRGGAFIQSAWRSVLTPSGTGRPNIGGPGLSPDMVSAGRSVGGGAGASGGGTPLYVQIDGKTVATVLIPHVQRINSRTNRPVYG